MPMPGGGSPQGSLSPVLQAALKGLAGLLAARQGQLGSFAGGYQQAEQQQANMAYRDQQLGMQQEAQRRLAEHEAFQQEQAQIDNDFKTRQLQAQQQAQWKEQEAYEAELFRKDVANRFDSILAADPNAYANVTAPEGLRNLSINVKGIGTVNLADAIEKYGYNLSGKVKPPTKPEREPLVTVPGPDGPMRAPDGPGVKVYERPRVPKNATSGKPKRTTRIIKDDDPDSPTYGKQFRVVEDEEGNVIKQEPLNLGATAAPKKIGRFTVEVE